MVCGLVMSLAAVALAADAPQYRVPQVRLPLTPAAPTIDGTVNEDEWSTATRMERFAWKGLLTSQEASFWVACDGKEIFIAVVSETPPDGKILQRVTPQPEGGDARTWMDDSIELVLDPLHTDTSGRRRIYHANINAKGAINDTAFVPNGSGEGWRGNWRIASKIIGNRWHFELAIPLADMNVTSADLDKPFGIRVCRNWHQQAEGPTQSEWSPIYNAFLNPETIPLVTWDATAPVVQVLQLHEPQQPLAFRAKLSIRNPRTEPIELRGSFKSMPKGSAPRNEDKPIKVAAGAIEIVEFQGNGLPGEEVYGSIEIASPDGATVYYLRDFLWKLHRPDPAWVLDEDAARKVDVSFAYFPYHDTIKTIVSFTGLAEKERVAGVTIAVRGKDQPTPIAQTTLDKITDYRVQSEWKIPPLAEGEYEFVAQLEGLKADAVVVPFVRHVMQWERNNLGKSDVVIEPFEPVRVDGAKVSTILRTHTMSALGLWDQVESLDKPLLKSPMRLEVRADGKPHDVAAQALKFTETKPTGATARSTWQAGHFSGTVQSEWDYDGLMKWTLTIAPSDQPIESMTLVIPLDDALMPLMHACTDGLRFNYAGAVPAGTGRVWEGSKAARNSIIGSYVPYIWIGAEERGLCVFGENDRGWMRDPKVPCQEIVRTSDGTLELRFNLIAAPATIDQPRTIVLGFQATPTKPMPPLWRTWGMSADGPGVGVNFIFLGSCYTMGTLGPCNEIYPRDEDFSIYHKLAETRRTGEIDQAFIKQWLASYPPMDEYFTRHYEPSLAYAFRALSVKPDGVRNRVVQYTNARGVRFDTREGQSFLDEWHRDAFPNRKWNALGDGVAYDLDPVESFRDYAMWYYNKMLDSFVDDIYWDDIFMQSNFDTVGTDAYELPDGTIQPSSGLWNMRQLLRRTAVLNHERGRRAYNMPHITNTAIAPILSFSGTILNWEDRAGETGFQERFPRDYIRAESIGRQHGVVPFCLTNQQKTPWALRTLAGVALTHEIKPLSSYHSCNDHYKAFMQLLEFGYGKPDVRVWNYWDNDYPVTIHGTDTSSLLVSKPGSAILIVCDYATGGDVTVTFADSLGLGRALKATDMESGAALDVSDGHIRFPLKQHDFKIIHVEAAPL